MKSLKSFKMNFRKKDPFHDGGRCGVRMKQLPFMGILCIGMVFVVYRTMIYQHHQTQIDARMDPFDISREIHLSSWQLRNLPRGIVQAASDLELRPLWSHGNSNSKKFQLDSSGAEVEYPTGRYLLAMPVGIKQKHNVHAIVQKFLPENFTIMLFHYDGKLDGWNDLAWSAHALHVVAHNQTKWWFAKRFLHPNIVSLYDYIFLWDEDLGVRNFHPGRYLRIVRSAGLEISQPALHPNSTEIHHRITIRARTKKFHRRVWDMRGSTKCTNSSRGPPCTGFVEGMAPVFSRSAWFCTWHLLQNDLVHGWGMDIKLGYCAQGDRTKKVGVVDSEYIFHMGIQTLGGGDHSGKKASSSEEHSNKNSKHGSSFDVRMEIRRQSTRELEIFKERWNKAVEEDKNWFDPFTMDSVVVGDDHERRRLKHRHKVRA
ncbi:hypothetical protein SAY86_010476 [Trapa natans]|uniref:Lysine ketoglutarate reductase trans-splicing-like protein n=1 Tax=Trapa natans TaxID=22666 RepID=A0AAN7LEQ3_TRANT|nr:hypothetical protein SAY86_010476 [Trapa natans]